MTLKQEMIGMPMKITLRAARVNVGLSQKGAADRLGVSNKTLCSWENGKTFPPADKIPEICALYCVSYDALNFLPANSLLAN
jgi:transcriptional regulator with XRE-family HTH domain